MKNPLRQSTVRVFEPNGLAPNEKERLLAALEGFANLGDSPEDFLAFGRQNPEFFPARILDEGQRSKTPVPPPALQGLSRRWEGRKFIDGKPQGGRIVEERYWTKMLAWEPACHRMFLLHRDALREAWPRPRVVSSRLLTGQAFLVLLGITPPEGFKEWRDAFDSIRGVYPRAKAMLPEVSRLVPDARTGTFDYLPDNDFQKAVYILFREGWRAKVCARCERRFVANKPVQRYCSTSCFSQTKRERGLAWWKAHGKQWRAKDEASSKRPSHKKTRRRR